MLLLESLCQSVPRPDARLVLPFELRQKSRLRVRLETGEEAGVFLPRGTILRGGDHLRGNDGRVILVVAANEALTHAACASAHDLVRAAYHLGNRHVPVQIGDGWLRFAADAVLAELMRTLGVAVSEVSAPFEPEAGAYGGGHHDHSGEARHGGVIHDYRLRIRS
jgi:urease accessory protein